MSGFRRIMRCKTFTSVDHHSNRPPLKWLKVLGLWYRKQWDKIIELHATGKLEDEWWRKTTSENSIDEPGVTRQTTIMSYPSHNPPRSRRGYVASAQCKNLVCADDEEIHEPFISGRRSNKSAIDQGEGNAQTKTQTGLVY
ncbi:hypothetical protein L873DRAFT_1799820 [Choiromyces venosus 120613-1]|uniref:Uncharacterized protein n=1 Tax=Choiromyces venosus 120613-1 TaxID=1336337 RepID=A0A3N4KEK1_9PEZI|nr:hypothetical protein L873DRAFT_1799820 [Choiromyces venosus 120613-1]